MTGTLVQFVNGEDRSAGDHDADHPLPQQPRTGRVLAGGTGTGRRASRTWPAWSARLPTCRPIMAAARWSTAISPARPAAGSRPASTFGTSTSRPNRPSTGAMIVGPLAPRSPWPSGSRLRPTTGATAPAPGSRASASKYPPSPEAVGRDEQIRGFRGRQETRVGARCPRRPRGRGQHRTPRNGHQQHQHRPAPPPGTQLVGGEINDCPHPITPRSGTRPRRPPWVRG